MLLKVSFTALALAAALAALVRCSPVASGLGESFTAPSTSNGPDLQVAASSDSVPLRVDYSDRQDVFDLDLLGVATGMCSHSSGCDACSYRNVNPCQVRAH